MVRYHVFRRTAPAIGLCLVLLLSACQLIIPPVPLVMGIETSTTPPPMVAPLAPLPVAQSLSPVQFAIPALGLEAPVVPMGWEVAEVDGEWTTQWVVPDDAIGWHVNSAGAGAAGRVILSGHQVMGAAPLAALAQGAVTPGQEILLTDADGVVFVYRIIEVSEPLSLLEPSAEEEALTAAYLAPTNEALLTVITGWPDFSTTHRIFAVAELVGLQN
jgi:hypothetical protein